MKVFISQPMKGRSEADIRNVRNMAATMADIFCAEFEEETEILDSYISNVPKGGTMPLRFLARSLDLLAQADVVSLHVPLTDETRGMIGAEELALMKETAVLVNTARGPVVDTKALADALNSGRIAGAAIDVFDKEPPLDADEPLINAKNTAVTPHVAFATDESMIKRAEIEFRNIAEFIKDKR